MAKKPDKKFSSSEGHSKFVGNAKPNRPLAPAGGSNKPNRPLAPAEDKNRNRSPFGEPGAGMTPDPQPAWAQVVSQVQEALLNAAGGGLLPIIQDVMNPPRPKGDSPLFGEPGAGMTPVGGVPPGQTPPAKPPRRAVANYANLGTPVPIGANYTGSNYMGQGVYLNEPSPKEDRGFATHVPNYKPDRPMSSAAGHSPFAPTIDPYSSTYGNYYGSAGGGGGGYGGGGGNYEYEQRPAWLNYLLGLYSWNIR